MNIVVSNTKTEDTVFKIKSQTPLNRIVNAWCERYAKPNDNPILTYNSNQLSLSLSAADYELPDNCRLEIIFPEEQDQDQELMQLYEHNQNIKADNDWKAITIVINDVHFIIRDTSPLRKCARAFEERKKLTTGSVKLFIDDIQLDQSLTSRDYGLVDNTVLTPYISVNY